MRSLQELIAIDEVVVSLKTPELITATQIAWRTEQATVKGRVISDAELGYLQFSEAGVTFMDKRWHVVSLEVHGPALTVGLVRAT
jgi:hypothetical protein